jgi:ankyrin repeat protein
MKKITVLYIFLSVGILIITSCNEVVTEKRMSQIQRAIANGDVEGVKTILKSDPSVGNARDSYKSTPLHYCAENTAVAGLYLKSAGKDPGSYDRAVKIWLANRRVIAELLISHGADVNAKDFRSRTPLYWTACSGNLELAKLLLENKADVNVVDNFKMTALHIVAMNGNTAFARYLIGKGANVNAMGKVATPLINAVEEHKDMVELLLNNKADVHMTSADGFAPIHLAGNKDIAQLLFSHGAILETRGYHQRTPLHQAAMRNRNDIVEWLCAKGVNVNMVDSDGETPLTIAITQTGDNEKAKKTSLETISILLRYGADPNYRDKDGKTLLHTAVFRERGDLVDVLLRHAADINVKNKFGETALHLAISYKNKDMVELLVSRGADVNARNFQNRTPLYVLEAQHSSSEDAKKIAELLKSHGGTR